MFRLLDESPPTELEDPAQRQHRAPAAHASESLSRVQQVWALHQQLAPRVVKDGLGDAYQQIEVPVVIPTLAMTCSGVRVNLPVLKRLRESRDVQLEIGRRQLEELAGRQINPDAPREVAQLLYRDFALPVPSYSSNSGQPSISKYVLQQLASLHPRPASS